MKTQQPVPKWAQDAAEEICSLSTYLRTHSEEIHAIDNRARIEAIIAKHSTAQTVNQELVKWGSGLH